ncbi:MAG: response regulator [Thermodesulfobacteriota bacterium]
MTEKKKILVVEDNLMNKILIRDILDFYGYSVCEAVNGREALEKARSEKPDIIIMDLHLPEMDGVTAMKILKSKDEMKDIPIIALTAAAMKWDEKKIIREGFDGYVPKPIDIKVLMKAVEEKMKSL